MTFEEAKSHLKDHIQADGSLYNLGWYLSWDIAYANTFSPVLDGEFTVEDLEAIAVYVRGMRNMRQEAQS